MYSLKQIADIVNGVLIGSGTAVCSEFLTDSRQLIHSDKAVFFALKSSRNNGHLYIQDLISRGVTSFVVSESISEDTILKSPKVSFLKVSNTLEALQKLAAYHREQFQIPVIGITGSNGKTMVKEWLYQLLKADYKICRSPKSYNSQIGVPLSVLNLNKEHTLAVFEAGISLPGEMQKLGSIIKPTTGVFTSFGDAHDKGFQNKLHKFSEKKLLFQQANRVIFNKVKQADINLPSSFITIGETEDCHYLAKFDASEKSTTISLMSAKKKNSFLIPFTDDASVLNASTCAALMLEMGYSEEAINIRMAKLQPLAIRLEVKNAIQNSVLINDFYNSDMDSIRIALSFLDQQHRRGKKVLIVSDVEQSGKTDQDLYTELALLVKRYEIAFIIGIGKGISSCKHLFQTKGLFYNHVDEFLNAFQQVAPELQSSTILLKGASSFQFEKISNRLQLKSHDTVLEINLNKLVNNINYYRSLISRDTLLMCMVKAMGYGSGSSEIAKTLQHYGVNYLAVAYADEGVELRLANIHLPIMVMSPEQDSYEDIIKYRLEPEIYSFHVLRAFAESLDKLAYPGAYPVHLKIDTGMKRLGFEAHHLEKLIEELKSTPQIAVKSVFSHLVASDNQAHDHFSHNQIELFNKLSVALEEGLGYTFTKHICNSGGISRFKQAHFGMVRLGVGMYGFGINEEENKVLDPVSCLKTRISQIKEVKAGETVGYNRKGIVNADIKIATIPIGYADGFHRTLGNGHAGVYVSGNYCKTIGNICMDMTMIDVSGIDCDEGDEVIVFENASQVYDLAAAMNSIPYEVLTNISSRVKRIYVQE
jgi:alanine racemase